MTFNEWQNSGDFIQINGHEIFYRDTGSDKPAILVLHGYPSSTHDFHRVLPLLASRYRLILHDHLGFGLSDKPSDYSYSLIDQADIAVKLWQKLGIKQGVLLAHDYGTSIATELIARHNSDWLPLQISQVVLSNGSMRIELAKPRLIQHLLMHAQLGPFIAKLSTKKTLLQNMRKIWGNSDTIHSEDMDVMWTMLEHNQGRKVLPKITQYIRERFVFWHRWIGALRSTSLPIHYIWARLDPVAREIIATTLHRETPNSTLHLLDGIGHYPMLEAPDIWGAAVLNCLESEKA
ncbi:MAG: putative hydrolase LipZ [Saprospiraceae bacterium]|nr:MAG: putative hydrolase LipZ [Saprospiraceae bacterium]